jgi:hypothetical protein
MKHIRPSYRCSTAPLAPVRRDSNPRPDSYNVVPSAFAAIRVYVIAYPSSNYLARLAAIADGVSGDRSGRRVLALLSFQSFSWDFDK